jgi:hypothetical protein
MVKQVAAEKVTTRPKESQTTKDKSRKKEKPTEEVEVPSDDSFEEADPKTLKPMKGAKV